MPLPIKEVVVEIYMAYVTYITEAIICGSWNRNTADRSYLLFTKRAGMLYADARSVREERSRQRYALQDFSRVRVSLIKGKNSWKIGSIESLHNHYHGSVSKEARGGVVALCRFLRRFVKGEGVNDSFFDYVSGAFYFLEQEEGDLNFLRLAMEVRILAFLGYVDQKLVPSEFWNVSFSSLKSLYSEALQKRLEILHEKAVSVSHL